MFALFNALAIFVLAALGGAGMAISQNNGPALFIPLGIYVLATLIPNLAVATRRFHDIGKSGWLLLLLCVLGIIPIVGIVCAVIQLVFLCQDSTPGANQYGPNPKFPEQGAVAYAGLAGFTPMAIPAQPQQPAVGSSFGFCKSCGARLTDGSPFCGSCGTRI